MKLVDPKLSRLIAGPADEGTAEATINLAALRLNDEAGPTTLDQLEDRTHALNSRPAAGLALLPGLASVSLQPGGMTPTRTR
jgi:hypothetical protein